MIDLIRRSHYQDACRNTMHSAHTEKIYRGCYFCELLTNMYCPHYAKECYLSLPKTLTLLSFKSRLCNQVTGFQSDSQVCKYEGFPGNHLGGGGCWESSVSGLGQRDTGSSGFHSPPASSIQALRLLLIRCGVLYLYQLCQSHWIFLCPPLPSNSIYTMTSQCLCQVAGVVSPWIT